MSPKAPRQDHWTTSLDAVDALRMHLADVEGAPDDVESRRLMAAFLHAKSTSFIALLDAEGYVLDVNPAALIAGGVDRPEVVGLPLPSTAWWTDSMSPAAEAIAEGVKAATAGRTSRFDVEMRVQGSDGGVGTVDLVLRPLRAR